LKFKIFVYLGRELKYRIIGLIFQEEIYKEAVSNFEFTDVPLNSENIS